MTHTNKNFLAVSLTTSIVSQFFLLAILVSENSSIEATKSDNFFEFSVSDYIDENNPPAGTSISSLRFENSNEKFFRPGRRRIIDIEQLEKSLNVRNESEEIEDGKKHGERYLKNSRLSDIEDETIYAMELIKKPTESNSTDNKKNWLTEFRGFSFSGLVNSIFSLFTIGISSIVKNIVGNESKSNKPRSNRINYKGYQLLRVTPTTEEQVAELQDMMESNEDGLKFWTMPIKNRPTDVAVAPDMLAEIKELLREQKYGYKVLINDLQKMITHQNPKMSKDQREDLVTVRGHSMTWKRYHRYGDIIRYLEYLAFTYPSLVKLVTIGQSYEGHPLKLAKVSSGPGKDGEPKPVIWIDGGMHAREWIGPAVATYILNQLVEKNSSYTKLLDTTDWVILPVSNPDGYEFSHTSDRLWRKTRSNHPTLSSDDNKARLGPMGLFHLVSHYTRWFFYRCEGVDPNRNFGYHWGEEENGATSADPCHETYAGPNAFSEPETRAIADYILANRQRIKMYLTLHAYSQMWLIPWGYTKSRPADYEDLANVAKKATNAILKVHGTQYQVGGSPDLLYPTSGASDDWAKGVAGIKYAYTLELRDRGVYGFLLPASQIVPTARETWTGIRAITRMVTCNT